MKNNIKNIRKDLGLTQAEFAEILGLTDKTVSAWERNERRLNDHWISLIAKKFNIPTSKIISDDSGDDDEWVLSAYKRAPQEIKNIVDGALRLVEVQK